MAAAISFVPSAEEAPQLQFSLDAGVSSKDVPVFVDVKMAPPLDATSILDPSAETAMEPGALRKSFHDTHHVRNKLVEMTTPAMPPYGEPP